MNNHFLAKQAKCWNFCIVKTTKAIPTKFWTVIKMTKYSLGVIAKFATQILNGKQLSLKNDTLLYLTIGLTDFDEILHVNAHWLAGLSRLFKKSNLKSPRCHMAAILRNVNSDMPTAVRPIWWNLVWRYMLVLPTGWVTKMWKSKMADSSHVEIEKSWYLQKPFGRFWQSFAQWHIVALHTILSNCSKIQILKI